MGQEYDEKESAFCPRTIHPFIHPSGMVCWEVLLHLAQMRSSNANLKQPLRIIFRV
jgi:hypothetical protein